MSVVIFVPDVAEFAPVLAAARQVANCRVIEPVQGYWRIVAGKELRFNRKALGLKPALWYSMLSGGYQGRITEYGRDELRLEAEVSDS